MSMNKEIKKREAIERMNMLKLHKNVINDFVQNNKLNVSENNGALYWINDKWKSLVEKFEKKHNAVVYHLIHNNVNGDEHLSFLYVSDHPDEWETDREDIKNGCPIVCVVNLTYELYFEIGSIGIVQKSGGVIRT